MTRQRKKATLNEQNKYNHNFVGRYCTCDKRYPPDENDDSIESQDEMLQCIVCEDWYHTKHLGVEELPNKFDELICGGCVEKLDFLRYYQSVNKQDLDDTNNTCDDEVAGEGSKDEDKTRNTESSAAPVCESDTNDSQLENKDPKVSLSDTTVDSKQTPPCKLEKLKASTNDTQEPAGQKANDPIFWFNCSWRSTLCKCPDCMLMYKARECEFLLDETDTVQYYEAQGRAIAKDKATPYERGMTALNQMNRAAVVEALHGYDELKADLSSYLRKFADSKKVVREEDINDFFAQLKSKKRPRLEYE